MAISTDDLARLRRLIDEPTQVPYSDLTLNTMYMTDGAQDVNLTAAEVWREKASKLRTILATRCDSRVISLAKSSTNCRSSTLA